MHSNFVIHNNKSDRGRWGQARQRGSLFPEWLMGTRQGQEAAWKAIVDRKRVAGIWTFPSFFLFLPF